MSLDKSIDKVDRPWVQQVCLNNFTTAVINYLWSTGWKKTDDAKWVCPEGFGTFTGDVMTTAHALKMQMDMEGKNIPFEEMMKNS